MLVVDSEDAASLDLVDSGVIVDSVDILSGWGLMRETRVVGSSESDRNVVGVSGEAGWEDSVLAVVTKLLSVELFNEIDSGAGVLDDDSSFFNGKS